MAKKPKVEADPTLASDEGVAYARTEDGEHIVNLSTDVIDAKRRELRIHGKAYHHTGENGEGHWVYRSDK